MEIKNKLRKDNKSFLFSGEKTCALLDSKTLAMYCFTDGKGAAAKLRLKQLFPENSAPRIVNKMTGHVGAAASMQHMLAEIRRPPQSSVSIFSGRSLCF